MQLRSPGGLLAAALCVGGVAVVALALTAAPLGLGGAGFGYKKVIGLLIGLEMAGCGVLLRQRLQRLR